MSKRRKERGRRQRKHHKSRYGTKGKASRVASVSVAAVAFLANAVERTTELIPLKDAVGIGGAVVRLVTTTCSEI